MKPSTLTLPKILFATTALTSAVLLVTPAWSNPLGENVVEGSATVSRPSATKTEINQSSDKAIIEWNSFDIREGEWTQFIQPNASSVTLNRVTGGDPSQIMGQLTANGTVMLVNPDGILFGKNSKIDVGGLIATTHDIENSDFMAGRYNFTKSGNPSASIINEGTITVKDSGVAAFVAPGVRNSGVITAKLGQVSLSSANSFTLDLYGDELIKLKVDDEIVDQVIDLATGQPMSALVDNQGRITADGGRVALTAATARYVVDNVINNDGIIEAKSVGTQNGQIVLQAQTAATKTAQAPEQNVRVSGKLDASGTDAGQTGGEIKILGEILGLTNVTVTTDGDAGGGIILVGGDYMGGDPDENIVARYGIALEDQDIPTATNLTVDEGSTLSASAITAGDGGKIVNWSDNITTFNGTILAKGGSQSGDGGFVEVSGKKEVFFDNINADLTAPNGLSGTILFDPEYSEINAKEASALVSLLNDGTNAINYADSIVVNSDIIKSSGWDMVSLILAAKDSLTISSGVVIGSNSGRLNVGFAVDADRGQGSSDIVEYYTNPTTNVVTVTTRAQDEIFSSSWELAQGLYNYVIDYISDNRTGFSKNLGELVTQLLEEGYISKEQYEEFMPGFVEIESGAKIYTNGGSVEFGDNTANSIVNLVKIMSDETESYYIVIEGDGDPNSQYSEFVSAGSVPDSSIVAEEESEELDFVADDVNYTLDINYIDYFFEKFKTYSIIYNLVDVISEKNSNNGRTLDADKVKDGINNLFEAFDTGDDYDFVGFKKALKKIFGKWASIAAENYKNTEDAVDDKLDVEKLKERESRKYGW
ncbi:filamentous hemagglutinin N-terminal domain-containing protein [uncultured Cohaesibacter sp.]|uniref:two-partner secretion domain-containing protein n=1 Tax=uncultured Cohaesibacter sp. TaxID=1002546 RepID=UPI00292E6CBD|nr:filamentous hemagglutinin N-terminal domain-containing protein [uncultured Cohaesibacter sp.]